MGSVGTDEGDENASQELLEIQKQGEALMNQVNECAKPGVKMVDTKDDKTIGQVLSTPAPGTPLVLAQMRLDRVGLMEGASPWSRTNKIRVGDQEFRYLPYIPLWWPPIDPTTGKAKEEQSN
jgi:hypothetical protein